MSIFVSNFVPSNEVSHLADLNQVLFSNSLIEALICGCSVQEIKRTNRLKSIGGLNIDSSWHNQYKDSAYIFVGGLDYGLTEGDIICIFSQQVEIPSLLYYILYC